MRGEIVGDVALNVPEGCLKELTMFNSFIA